MFWLGLHCFINIESSFHVPVGYLCVYFGENVFLDPLSIVPFLIRLFILLILDCRSCLSTLDINLLSVASLANIFFQSVGCLFILFMVSFAMQKLLNFLRSHLFIFAFYFYCLCKLT